MSVRRRDLLGTGVLVGVAVGVAGCVPEIQRLIAPAVLTIPKDRIETIFARWDALGEHRTGTTADNDTAQWLADEVHAIGAAPTLQAFPFRRRTIEQASIEVAGRFAQGMPAFDGGSTGPRGIDGPLGSLGSSARIGLTLAPPALAPGAGAALAAAREGNLHRAIVVVTDGTQVKPGLAPINADHYATPFGPPVLQLDSLNEDWLMQAAAAGAGARVIIEDSWQDTTAINVEARIEGRDPQAAPLVVMTPRSGWWRCSSERGGGIAVWLEMLRHFQTHQPRRTVLFTANTGHELGHLGLDYYLQKNPGLAKSAHAWIHLGANFAAAYGARVRLQVSSDYLRDIATAAMARFDATPDVVTPVATPPSGEARSVFDQGGQYVSLLGDNRLFHHPDDRWPSAVDTLRTTQIACAFVDLAAELAA